MFPFGNIGALGGRLRPRYSRAGILDGFDGEPSLAPMTTDLASIIRNYAFALADKIEEANKAIIKTDGHSFEVGRKLGFGLALSMLLDRMKRAGVRLDELGLGDIDPEAFINPPPRDSEPPPRVPRRAPVPKRLAKRNRG